MANKGDWFFNWGYGVLLAAIFLGGFITLVVRSG